MTDEKTRSPKDGKKKGNRDGKRPYRRPVIDSSEVFESFTLQSCNQVPEECAGALE